MSPIFLYGFGGHSIGPISVTEARVLMTLCLIVLLFVFLFWRYGNVFGKMRDWYRRRSFVPFEQLPAEKQRKILSSAYCLKCGQLYNLISPKNEVLRGERVIAGKCPKCGEKVVIRS